MPKNRFPDSLPKRELRRQDARRLSAFQSKQQLALGLKYCGMPSVEFLDVRAWRDMLRSVCAVEIDPEVLIDMRIEWDTLSLGLPVHFVNANILEFLRAPSDCYDLYNLDFYGGFLHPRRQGTSNCVEAIRSLINQQAAREISFVLIATFNVRDTGAHEYLRFIDDIPSALQGWTNVEPCCKAHTKNQATLLKLCFPYFCWNIGMSSNFMVRFENPVVYHSSATLVHFYAEFLFQPRTLPDLTSTEALVELANRPLFRLDGMIQRIEMRPPEITRIKN
jgi:hypothetical protein